MRKLLLVVFLGYSWMTSVYAQDKPLTIIYSGNLDGELEPCGCSKEGDFGGIKRRATMLDRLRHQNANLITLSAGGLLVSEGSNDRLKSQYILKGFNALHYDAIAMQWRDLGYGFDFINQDALPWVVSNWADVSDKTGRAVTHKKVITRLIDGRQYYVAFFSWLDPNKSPMREMKGKHSVVTDDKTALASAIADAKQKGMLTVLSTTLQLNQAQRLVPLKNVDILLIHAKYEVFGKPRQIGHTLVLQPGSRGMRIGRVDLAVDSSARIKSWAHKVIPLPDSIPDAPRLAGWYKEYNAKIKQDYLKRAKLQKQLSTGESPYVGAEQCKTCHSAQYKVWAGSKHSHAFEALENVNKSFDPSCIKCHVVGFDKPGGFIDFDMSSDLTNVQCENCHGAGRTHVKSAGKKKVPNADWPRKKICGQCHTHPHSPAFNIKTYWPKIAH